MLILLAVFAFLLLAGSLFPWHYQPGPSVDQAAWHVLTSWHEAVRVSSLHDLLVNLVIYVPIGFTGYLWRGWQSGWGRWSWPLLAGAALSFSIETLQHYFPPRAPGLVDVVCNVVSTLLGVALAAVFQTVVESRHVQWRRSYSIHLSSAVLLIGIWLSASAWPVHAFPLGIIGRIRQLLHPRPWIALDALDGVLQGLLAGCLLTTVTGSRAARWWLPGLLAGLFTLRLLAPGHEFTWSHVGGAAAALLVFWGLPERHRYTAGWLAWVWLAWLVLDGLRPFHWLSRPSRFDWVPFQGLVELNWMVSINTLLRKTWIYGAAYWLLAHTSLSRRAALILTLVALTAIEAAQCWLPGRTAGLTDPAIGLLAAALLSLVDYRFARSADPLSQFHPPVPSAVRPSTPR